MRKLIVSNMVSLDGYFAGPSGELGWHQVDQEFIDYSQEMLNAAGTLLFGRVTYELMASFWPTADARENDPATAGKMNGLEKIVYSKTMDSAGWENTTLVKEDVVNTIAKLKEGEGKNIVILGSANLISSLLPTKLIDEFFIIVNPVILGNGKPLFNNVASQINLQLISTKQLRSGVIILQYQTIH